MIEKLIIDNVAVIEHAEVDFSRGLNVLTGETGAGKSIVVDSINLVLGRRSSREIIRTGAPQASVTAVFSGLPHCSELTDDDGKLILERTVSADGRGSAKVNGKTVSVTQLREIGEKLAAIHGQHDNDALLDPARHTAFLDAYADDGVLLSAYREDYGRLKELAERIRSLKTENRDRGKRLELLKYQVAEIDDAAVKEGEEERLAKLRSQIRSREKINEALSAAAAALTDEENGAEVTLKTAADSLAQAESAHDGIRAVRERILGAAYEISDCAAEMNRILDENAMTDTDPAAVEARMDLIYRIKSKYGGTYEEIMRYRDRAAAEIDEYEDLDGLIRRLTDEYTSLSGETAAYADKLTTARRKAAEALCRRVREELEFLNMKGAVFYADVKSPGMLMPDGGDTVEFMLSANAGEEPGPLARIASGGELSRIMLAIRNALSEREGAPTQIFDEIDTGVSGKAAGKIGIKLKEISAGRQVLCVTHLAQIAAYADTHLLIEKTTEHGRTFTEITPVDGERQIDELARIMSGDAAGDAARTGARELLRYARENSPGGAAREET